MPQHYSNPKRASDPYALPDVETFKARYLDCPFCCTTVVEDGCGEFWCDSCVKGREGFTPEGAGADTQQGWFWWSCFPGCLPDSDPVGPFDTEADALADAQEGMEDRCDGHPGCDGCDPNDPPHCSCPDHITGEE